MCGGGTPGAISNKFGIDGKVANVINLANCGSCTLNILCSATGYSLAFLLHLVR